MTDAEYPDNKTIVQLLEEQAARIPNSIAITFNGQQLTYAQLNERANALARKLRKDYNIQPNDFVVISTEKWFGDGGGYIRYFKGWSSLRTG
ncbi:AMP-binding protein [Bacillus amyloliquefaciens]